MSFWWYRLIPPDLRRLREFDHYREILQYKWKKNLRRSKTVVVEQDSSLISAVKTKNDHEKMAISARLFLLAVVPTIPLVPKISGGKINYPNKEVQDPRNM